ncbi:MAG TPA: TadE family protein [Rickettsiales bacterium]|nr:TadE family protein [Rickettsiales bacterium]
MMIANAGLVSGRKTVQQQGALLARLISCEKAAAAVEFAIIIPLLLVLVFGIIECCIVSYQITTLDGALTLAAREGATGAPDVSDSGVVGGKRWNNMRTLLLERAGGMFDPHNIEVSATAYPDFASVGANGKGRAGSLGAPNEVVAYSVSYPYPMLPFMQSLFGSRGRIFATALVKNEAFAVTRSSASQSSSSSAGASQASSAQPQAQPAAAAVPRVVPAATIVPTAHMRACTPLC